MSEFGRGTVRTVRNREREIIGYQALLPRELSTPPADCENPDEYQEPIGPRFPTKAEARTLLDAAIFEKLDKRSLSHGLTLEYYMGAEIKARLMKARRQYETAARANRAVSTWRSIERLWVADQQWYTWPAQAIETADLQRWISFLTDEAEGRSGEPLSGDFIRNCARFVRASLERAGGPNPARDLKLPPKNAPKVPHLDLPAQRRWFGADEDEITERDRVMAGCGMGAGLRVGEPPPSQNVEEKKPADVSTHQRLRALAERSLNAIGDGESTRDAHAVRLASEVLRWADELEAAERAPLAEVSGG